MCVDFSSVFVCCVLAVPLCVGYECVCVLDFHVCVVCVCSKFTDIEKAVKLLKTLVKESNNVQANLILGQIYWVCLHSLPPKSLSLLCRCLPSFTPI